MHNASRRRSGRRCSPNCELEIVCALRAKGLFRAAATLFRIAPLPALERSRTAPLSMYSTAQDIELRLEDPSPGPQIGRAGAQDIGAIRGSVLWCNYL